MKFFRILNWKGLGFGKRKIVDGIQELAKLGAEFNKILKNIGENEILVHSWESIISNAETGENVPSAIAKKRKRGVIESCHKNGIAFVTALELYRILLSQDSGQANGKGFDEEKPGYVAKIMPLHPKLAKDIQRLGFSQKTELGILVHLRKIISNSQLAVSFIKTHYGEIMLQIDRMKDRKTADKLRRCVAVLSDMEKDEIIRCTDDVRNWSYKVVNNSQIRENIVPANAYLIVERGHLFINGGKSRYDNARFLGFNMHFRDAELVDQIRSSPEIRRLMNYIEELRFFIDSRNAIQKSVETQSNWSGFYEFYNNLEKGKNYIAMVRSKFGNEKLAKILEAFKESKHEAPIYWENELGAIGNEIRKSYQPVIGSAETAFLRIFDESMGKLESEKQSAMAGLAKLISQSGEMEDLKRKFLKILARARRILGAELDEEHNKFKIYIGSTFARMPELVSSFDEVMAKTQFNVELLAENAVLDSLITNHKNVQRNAQILKTGENALENDEALRQLNRMDASLYYSSVNANQERDLMRSVEAKAQESVIMLKGLIEIAQNEIRPKTNEYATYIRKRLENNYVPEIISVIARYNDAAKRQLQQNKEAEGRVVDLAGWKAKNADGTLPINKNQAAPNEAKPVQQRDAVTIDILKRRRLESKNDIKEVA